jgi:tetratricopeptide (TPR) repeat protein
MGMTYLFSGESDIAEPLLFDALTAFQEIGSRKGVAWANQNLAWISFMRGESDIAEERLESAVSMFSDIGDHGGLGWARGLLAWVYFSRGHLGRAEKMAREQIIEAREQNDRWALGMMTVLLASTQHWQGRIAESVDSLEEARQLFVDLNDHWGQLRAVVPLARGLQAIGQRSSADLLLVEAEALVEDYPTSGAERLLPTYLGIELAIQRGDGTEAMRLIDHAEAEAGKQLDPGSAGGESVVNRAVALAMTGRADEGVPLLRSAAAGLHDPGQSGNVLSAFALALATTGDTAGVRTQVDRVTALDGGSYLDHTLAQLALACASAADGDQAGALAALDAADQRLSLTDDELAKAVAQLARARVLQALGSPSAGDVLAVARAALAELSTDGEGWDVVFKLATNLESSTTSA